ncbi:hypothetical protein JCM8097_001813 [Rhodosporidiobolus ruineniae]
MPCPPPPAPPTPSSARPPLFLLLATLVLVALPLVTLVDSRSITVTNNCAITIWPGLYTAQGTVPDQPTGWEAAPGNTVSFEVTNGWGGRIWGRCSSGGCNGGLECASSGGTGVPPATVAEFYLEDTDNYDASNVDGFNLPLAITSDKDCPLANCPYNLNDGCPDALQVKNKNGDVVGCNTDCGAYPTNEEYCCTGAHDTAATCPESGIPDYDWFKKGCPFAYAYAYDEHSGTALWTCDGGPSYVVTFCPTADLYDLSVTLDNGTVVTQGSDGYKTMDTYGGGGSGGGGGGSSTTTAAASSKTTGGRGGAATTTGGGAATTTGGGAAASSKSSTASTAKATTTGSTGSGSSTGSSSSSDTSSSSSSSTDDGTLLGMPKTTAYIVFTLLGVLLIGAIGFFIYMQSKKKDKDGGPGKHHHAAAADDDATGSSTEGDASTDDDAGGGGGKKSKKKKHRRSSSTESSTGSSDGDDEKSLAKFDALAIAERGAARRSVYTATGRRASAGGGGEGRVFELPKRAGGRRRTGRSSVEESSMEELL